MSLLKRFAMPAIAIAIAIAAAVPISSARAAVALSPAANRAFAPITSKAHALPNDGGDFDVAVAETIARGPASDCECRSFSSTSRRACLERRDRAACDDSAQLNCFWACATER